MRFLRTSLRAAGILATFVVVVLVIAVLVSQTSWFRDWLRRYAMREAAQLVDGQLVIGRIDGGLCGGVQLHDVHIDRNGETLVALDTLTLEYGLLDFVREGVVIRTVELVAPRIALRRDGDTWNVATLLVEQAPSDPDAPRATFRVDSITLRDGLVTIDDPTCPAGTAGCLPARVENVQAMARLASTVDALDVELQQASFDTSEPDLALRRLAVAVTMTDADVAVSGLDVASAPRRSRPSTSRSSSTTRRSRPRSPPRRSSTSSAATSPPWQVTSGSRCRSWKAWATASRPSTPGHGSTPAWPT